MNSLVLDERIKTTEAKAKSIKSSVEKLVTLAKKKDDASKRFLSEHLSTKAIDKMINKIAPQFSQRPGGYTRIIRMGKRVSDSASMVVMEWSEEIIKSIEPKQSLKKDTKSKSSQSKKSKPKKEKSKPSNKITTKSKKVESKRKTVRK